MSGARGTAGGTSAGEGRAGRVGRFVARELVGSLRARWFLAYAAVFLAGGLVVAGLGGGDSVVAGYRSYARALAGLVHFALLFVPLMALLPAAASIAEDRESGTLEYLLAQPVTHGEMFVGKWLGVAVAVTLALTAGWLAAGSVAVLRGVPTGLVLLSWAFLLLLALAFVSIGLLLSAASPTRARAVTLGVVIWLALLALGSLGAMAAFIRWGLPAEALIAWSFVDPVEAYRLGTVAQFDADLSILGPVGAGLARDLGPGGLATLAAGSLGAWIVVPLWLGARTRLGRAGGVLAAGG